MNLQVSISQRRSFLIGCCVLFVGVSGLGGQEVQRDDDASHLELFRKENLVAWCIVPFDKNKRGPVERAEMLKDLGIKKVAYDWRAEHVLWVRPREVDILLVVLESFLCTRLVLEVLLLPIPRRLSVVSGARTVWMMLALQRTFSVAVYWFVSFLRCIEERFGQLWTGCHVRIR